MCQQSYPCSKATVKICGVVVAEDHLEAFLRHRLDGEVGGVGGVCPQLDRVLVPGEIIDNVLECFKDFSLVHEMNVVRMCQLVAPDRHLRRGLLQGPGCSFHGQTGSGEEVVPEVHEVLLLVTLALCLQPGQDALGGVPAAKVHLLKAGSIFPI